MKRITIGICYYPNALKSAIYGLEELFFMANNCCRAKNIEIEFQPIIFSVEKLLQQPLTVIILPPSLQGDYYLDPDLELLAWLKAQYNQGAIIASACAGAFILAATNLPGKREITTHWGLAELFHQQFPELLLNINKIVIDHGDVMTAGGMMSWLDLALELVIKFSSLTVMRQLGRRLVVDTALREQCYYQQFTPSLQHGDAIIANIQQKMNRDYQKTLSIKALAEQFNLTERTLQRRFLKATGFNPTPYLQRLRVQKACDLLEGSKHSFEWVAHQVGYEDPGACRKVFIKIMGLTPKAFRIRFNR